MKSIQINGTARAEFGKKFAKAARREGQVPCIIYGGGEEKAYSAPMLPNPTTRYFIT